MKKLNSMVFDAGGALLYISVLAIPVFLIVMVLAIIFVTVYLIVKARK